MTSNLISTTRLNSVMTNVIDRLKIGDGRIVSQQGEFWLPGEVANRLRKVDAPEWFEKSLSEFGCHVGVQTIKSMVDRGLLTEVRRANGEECSDAEGWRNIYELSATPPFPDVRVLGL